MANVNVAYRLAQKENTCKSQLITVLHVSSI